MFDRVTITASDWQASRRFYLTVLETLGRAPTHDQAPLAEWNDFAVVPADGRAATSGLHIGFAAPSHAHVQAFHRAGVDAGFRGDGAPGPRPEYGDDYFGAFLLDPDGNSAEAVVHGGLREGGIDHLWIRVADHAASVAFYAAIAPHAGYRQVADLPGRTRFSPGPRQGSFSIVKGSPTSPFHVAFAAAGQTVFDGVDPNGNEVEVVTRRPPASP